MNSGTFRYWLLFGTTEPSPRALHLAVDALSATLTRVACGSVVYGPVEPVTQPPGEYVNLAAVFEGDCAIDALRERLKFLESAAGRRSQGIVPLDIDLVLCEAADGAVVHFAPIKLDPTYARRAFEGLRSASRSGALERFWPR